MQIIVPRFNGHMILPIVESNKIYLTSKNVW